MFNCLISVQTENKRGAFKTNRNQIKGDTINDYKKGFILRMKGAVSFCMSKSKGFITKYFQKIPENIKKNRRSKYPLLETMT